MISKRVGISPKKIVEVINSSSGRSWSSQYKFPTFVLNNAFNSGFTLNLMNKDLEIATDLARELNFPMFLGSVVQQIFKCSVIQGRGEDCHTAIVKLIEDWGGVKVRNTEGD